MDVRHAVSVLRAVWVGLPHKAQGGRAQEGGSQERRLALQRRLARGPRPDPGALRTSVRRTVHGQEEGQRGQGADTAREDGTAAGRSAGSSELAEILGRREEAGSMAQGGAIPTADELHNEGGM